MMIWDAPHAATCCAREMVRMPPPMRTFHSEILVRARAEHSNEIIVCASSHRGIQVDDVQPGVGLESMQEAKNVGDGNFAFSTLDQLDGLPALQVDAGISTGAAPQRPSLRGIP